MGLALHNYADVNKGTFPDSRWFFTVTINGTRHDRDYGPNLLLLDYLEQGALKEYFTSNAFNVTNADGYAPNGTRIPARGGQADAKLACYRCPSDGSTSNPGGDNTTLGMTNYVWSFGDHQLQQDAFLGRGAFIMYRERGAYGSLSNLADGTSNTLVFSEAVRPYGQTGFGACVSASLARKDPRTDLYPLYDKGKKSYVAGVNSPASNYDQRGFRWASFTSWYIGFSTVLPPNSGNFGDATQSTYILATASSNHTGGVNCTLGDGSVQFISETINWQTPNPTGAADFYLLPANSRDSDTYAISKMTPQSRYGVWGALGTASGGESVNPF